MTHADDIKTIRDALDVYRQWSCECDVDTDDCDLALAAFERLENDGMRLPVLPDGWRLYKLDCSIDGRANCMISLTGEDREAWFLYDENMRDKFPLYISAVAPTPRAAMIAAIAQIQGEK